VTGTPTLLYDGDCGFCQRSVDLAKRLGTTARVLPWQAADLAAFGTTPERAGHELLWVARLLTDCGGPWRLAGALLRLPPLSWLAHLLYRLVAGNRHRLPGGTAACVLPAADRPRPRPQAARHPAARQPEPAREPPGG
jgi:predicted DCC family thiol-disulfide oxidoreductase YuxK